MATKKQTWYVFNLVSRIGPPARELVARKDPAKLSVKECSALIKELREMEVKYDPGDDDYTTADAWDYRIIHD